MSTSLLLQIVPSVTSSQPFYFIYFFFCRADVSSLPVRVCGTASACYAHFSDTLIDTGGINPLLLSRCVRYAVKQRCWRISRNAFLQGGKSGATGGQREGSARTVETFYPHGRWVRTLTSELKLRNGGTGAEMEKKRGPVKKKDCTGLNQSDDEPIRTETGAGLCWTRAPVCQGCLGLWSCWLHVPFPPCM